MVRSSLRETCQKRSSKTRQRALQTVVRLMRTKPPREITFSDISAVSGISVGAITFRFGSRDALMGLAVSSVTASASREITRKCDAAASLQSTEAALCAVVADLYAVFEAYRFLLHDETAACFRQTVLTDATERLERLMVQRCLNEHLTADLGHFRHLARMLVETLANRPGRDELPHFAALCSNCLRNTDNAR